MASNMPGLTWHSAELASEERLTGRHSDDDPQVLCHVGKFETVPVGILLLAKKEPRAAIDEGRVFRENFRACRGTVGDGHSCRIAGRRRIYRPTLSRPGCPGRPVSMVISGTIHPPVAVPH